MNLFSNLPIRRKLVLGMLLTSTTVLFIACSAFMVYEVRTFRANLEHDMTVLADVISRNCTAALQFDDALAAETTLQALGAEPHIVSACLFKAGNGRFATYLREAGPPGFPGQEGRDGATFMSDHMALFAPVLLNGKRIGTLYMRVDLEGMRNRVKLYLGIVILVLAGSVGLTLLLASVFQRLVSRPILALAQTATIIRERKDYSARAGAAGRDEIGHLTEAFNQMLDEIEAGQGALRKAHESLLVQTAQILEGVGVLSSSARQILSFSTQLASNSVETANSVVETTTTVSEVRQTVQLSTQKARQVAEGSRQTAQISQDGERAARDAAEGMRRIRQQMDSIADSLLRLNEQGHAIQQIIATVEDLAAQSNLLAVNASIEAAKAGEQGRGFAVVAQEVRSLADQSRQATTEVRAILKEIQRATSVAVLAAEQGTRVVETGVSQSTQAGESILTLARSVAEGTQAITQIAATSQQQLAGMDQVVTAIQRIKHAAVQNAESARELEVSARHLDELGQRLRGMVVTEETGAGS